MSSLPLSLPLCASALTCPLSPHAPTPPSASHPIPRTPRARLLHRPVLPVPGLDDAGPRRPSRYCKRPVVSSHGEEGVRHHTDIRPHPRMHVALHRDHHFLPPEALGERSLPRRLR